MAANHFPSSISALVQLSLLLCVRWLWWDAISLIKSGGTLSSVQGSWVLMATLRAATMQKTIMIEKPLSSQPSMMKLTKEMPMDPIICTKLVPMTLIWVGYSSRTYIWKKMYSEVIVKLIRKKRIIVMACCRSLTSCSSIWGRQMNTSTRENAKTSPKLSRAITFLLTLVIAKQQKGQATSEEEPIIRPLAKISRSSSAIMRVGAQKRKNMVLAMRIEPIVIHRREGYLKRSTKVNFDPYFWSPDRAFSIIFTSFIQSRVTQKSFFPLILATQKSAFLALFAVRQSMRQMGVSTTKMLRTRSTRRAGMAQRQMKTSCQSLMKQKKAALPRWPTPQKVWDMTRNWSLQRLLTVSEMKRRLIVQIHSQPRQLIIMPTDPITKLTENIVIASPPSTRSSPICINRFLPRQSPKNVRITQATIALEYIIMTEMSSCWESIGQRQSPNLSAIVDMIGAGTYCQRYSQARLQTNSSQVIEGCGWGQSQGSWQSRNGIMRVIPPQMQQLTHQKTRLTFWQAPNMPVFQKSSKMRSSLSWTEERYYERRLCLDCFQGVISSTQVKYQEAKMINFTLSPPRRFPFSTLPQSFTGSPVVLGQGKSHLRELLIQ